MDSRFDTIQRKLEEETKELKKTYEELSEDLKTTNRDLLATFKEKIHAIRVMASTFFARTEAEVKENTKRTKDIDEKFEKFSADFVNPSKELDGRIFAMNTKIAEAELTRE